MFVKINPIVHKHINGKKWQTIAISQKWVFHRNALLSSLKQQIDFTFVYYRKSTGNSRWE